MNMPAKCPNCGGRLQPERTPWFPFCSERCRLIDLGAWLDESRGIPAESSPAYSDDGTDPTKH